MVISTEDSIERNFRIANNNAIDMHVGKRVRLRRTLLGMSQEQLGTELNITFQQVQKNILFNIARRQPSYERHRRTQHGAD